TENLGDLPLPADVPGPAERAELRDRLGELQLLSERQRRLVWLRAAGLSHVEMAAFTGDTLRTVQRQIARASERMRQHQSEPVREYGRDAAVASPRRIGPRVRDIGERGLDR